MREDVTLSWWHDKIQSALADIVEHLHHADCEHDESCIKYEVERIRSELREMRQAYLDSIRRST